MRPPPHQTHTCELRLGCSNIFNVTIMLLSSKVRKRWLVQERERRENSKERKEGLVGEADGTRGQKTEEEDGERKEGKKRKKR